MGRGSADKGGEMGREPGPWEDAGATGRGAGSARGAVPSDPAAGSRPGRVRRCQALGEQAPRPPGVSWAQLGAAGLAQECSSAGV